MNLEDKTKEQLIEELRILHHRVADLECRLRELKQGKEFLGDAQGQPVDERPPNLAKVSEQDEMLHQEVARRTQLESQLAQSEQLYRKLVETARDVIWTVDLDLNYTYVSPSVTKVLGYTVEEIMSMNPLSTMTPLSRDRIVGAFQEELALEASGPRDKYTGRSEEIEQHHKDGSTRWQEITTTFLRANDGGPIGILGISHDITERKHMEEELRQSRDELEQKVQERTSDLTKLNKRLLLEIDERKKVEEAFRQGEERLELALKGADLGLWDLYPQTGQGFVNQRSAEIVGYSLAEIQPSLGFWESLLHPDDRVRTVETVLAHLEGRTDYYEDEYRVKTKSGEWKWIFSGGKVVEHDPDGRPLRMSGIYRDITERKRAEKDLLESRERLQIVLDTIPAPVFWKDSDSVYVGANRAWLVAAGLNSSQEVVGKTDYDLPWEKGQADSYREHDRKVIESGIPAYDIIEPYTRTDGTLAWARTNKVPLRDLEDNVVGILGTYEDVTDRKQAEEALRRSEERLELALQGADLGLWDWHVQTGQVVANRRSADMVGYSIHEIQQGFVFWEKLLHPDDRERALEKMSNQLAGLTDYYEDEYQVRHKSGDWRWIFSRGKVTERDLDGKPLRMTGTYLDITDKKVAQSQASEANELREQMVSESPMGIAVYREDGQCISANEALGRIVGANQERLLTQNFRILSSWKDSGLLAEADQVLSGGINTQREVHVTSTFGKSFWVNARMARITSGGKPHLLIVFNDITERRTVEDALRSEREQLLSIFESVNDVVMVIDTQTYEILYANKYTEDLYGKKLIGGFCYERLTGFDTPCGHCFNDKILELQGQPYQWEYSNPILKRDFLATDRMIRWPDGREVKFQIAIDITERNNAQQEQAHLRAQLFQAQKMESVGTLAGGIAHDFNNLLQVTLGYSELLLQEKTEHDADYGDLQKIFHAAKSGAELVRSLMAFSRKAEPKPVPMDLNHKIRHVEKLLHRTIPRMIDIRLDLAEDLERINADPAQVEQIIMNLAVNARDAMGEEGSLKIRTESVTLDDEYCRFNVEAKPGDFVLLSVSDTGHGMDRETLQRIFEPFYTTKELGRGTGLGLAMVYGIVRQHGGHIDCYSEVGTGTTFKLYFPVIPSIEEPAVEATGIMPAFGTETVLLVDDEDLVRDLGQRILTRSGYTVLTAARGEEALEVYGREKERIALVILDLIMPTMGGKDCLKKMLKIDPQARILISSGYSADASKKECLGMGAKGFVAKPFRFKEFLQQVRMALDEM